MPHQPDMFGATPQVEAQKQGDPERIRRKLNTVLDQLRGASEMPLDEKRLSYFQHVFPQDDGLASKGRGTKLCAEFFEEVRRLELSAVA